jgi:hypothetical protein
MKVRPCRARRIMRLPSLSLLAPSQRGRVEGLEMAHKLKCDLKVGWNECWNTVCRKHGKAALRWHVVRRLRLDNPSDKTLAEEEKELYTKLCS